MKSFARHTKLSNICGRVDYILSEEKQEEIVTHSEYIDFKEYAEFEKNNQKSAIKNNEGREVVISIPNGWYELPKKELHEKCQHLAEVACNKKTDMVWSCHWNENRTNLHIHVVFSERTKLQEIKKWDRDVYLTNDGKVARKKADRAVDERTGEVLPPVHRKGDIKEGGFSTKDKIYKTRDWFENTKEKLQNEMEKMGVKFEEKGVLHEYHEGKGKYSYITKEKNEVIREINERSKQLKSVLSKEDHKKLEKVIKNEFKKHNIIVPGAQYDDNNKLKLNTKEFKNFDFSSAKQYIDKSKNIFKETITLMKKRIIEAIQKKKSNEKAVDPQPPVSKITQKDTSFDYENKIKVLQNELLGYMKARYQYEFAMSKNITMLKSRGISHKYRNQLKELDANKSRYDEISSKIDNLKDDLNHTNTFNIKKQIIIRNEIKELEKEKDEIADNYNLNYYEQIRDNLLYDVEREQEWEYAYKQLDKNSLAKEHENKFLELSKDIPEEFKEKFYNHFVGVTDKFVKLSDKKNYAWSVQRLTNKNLIERMPKSKERQLREFEEKMKTKTRSNYEKIR